MKYYLGLKVLNEIKVKPIFIMSTITTITCYTWSTYIRDSNQKNQVHIYMISQSFLTQHNIYKTLYPYNPLNVFYIYPFKWNGKENAFDGSV